MRHIGPCQSLDSRQSLSCIVVTQAKLQAHTPEYSHISSATLKTYGKAYHLPSSSILGPSMYGMNMLGTGLGGLNWGNETSWVRFLLLSLITLLDCLEPFLQVRAIGWFPWKNSWHCFRHYGSLNQWLQDTSNEHSYNTLPDASYMQAGNFCIKHCRDCWIFTQAESEAVLHSLGHWIWDYRTLPRMNIKQYLLCKLYTSLIHTSHSASYISNLVKSNKCSNTSSYTA